MSAQDLPFSLQGLTESYCKCGPPLKHNKSFSQYFARIFYFKAHWRGKKRNGAYWFLCKKSAGIFSVSTPHNALRLVSLNPLRVKLRPNSLCTKHWNPILRLLRFWIYCCILSQQNQLAWNFHCARALQSFRALDWLMGRGTLAVRLPKFPSLGNICGGNDDSNISC